jgi:hypothetical protein
MRCRLGWLVITSALVSLAACFPRTDTSAEITIEPPAGCLTATARPVDDGYELDVASGCDLALAIASPGAAAAPASAGPSHVVVALPEAAGHADGDDVTWTLPARVGDTSVTFVVRQHAAHSVEIPVPLGP